MTINQKEHHKEICKKIKHIVKRFGLSYENNEIVEYDGTNYNNIYSACAIILYDIFKPFEWRYYEMYEEGCNVTRHRINLVELEKEYDIFWCNLYIKPSYPIVKFSDVRRHIQLFYDNKIKFFEKNK